MPTTYSTAAATAFTSFLRNYSTPVGSGSSRPAEGKMWPRGSK